LGERGADPIVLAQQLSAISQRISLIVYEAGPTGYCLERVLKANGYKVAVVAPSRIPRPVTNQAKTDKLDCLKLAEYAVKGMIEAITTPTEQESAERSVLRRRNQLVDSTRKTKQRIKSFLLFHGIEEEYGLRYPNKFLHHLHGIIFAYIIDDLLLNVVHGLTPSCFSSLIVDKKLLQSG
jgi:transposase